MNVAESPIASRSNPLIKQARALRQRKARAATGLFLVEGIHHVGEAAEAGWQIEAILYAPDLLTSAFARRLIDQQAARGVRCQPVAAQVFGSLADKENPPGILAVVRQRCLTLERLTPKNFAWGAALVSPQDPGNLGAILRTIDAVGAAGLILLDGGVDHYHPGAVRAGMGALFWKPVAQSSFGEFVDWARRGGYRLIGASAHAAADYRAVKRGAAPTVLLLGSEQKGLSEGQKAACDVVVSLPMRGRAASLNLAVAAGILLYAFGE